MLKNIINKFLIIIPVLAVLYFLWAIVYNLWHYQLFPIAILMSCFLIIVAYYLSTMSNQSIFLGYFNSWEWKPFHKQNDLQEIAGDHAPLLHKAIINFLITVPLIILSLWALIHFKLLNLYSFEEIIWFRSDILSQYISNAWIIPVYWCVLLSFSIVFLISIIYVLLYHKYPNYNVENAPLSSQILLAYRKVSIRDAAHIFCTMNLLIYSTVNFSMALMAWVALFVLMFSSKIYWLLLSIPLYIVGLGGSIYVMLSFPDLFIQIIGYITNILKWLIPISLFGTIILILLSMLITVTAYFIRNKKSHSLYTELTKMNPHWGFNWNFVSESFVNDEIISNQELYEQTSPRKKCFFWPEYFFANILNRNVKTLLADKNTLFWKVLFNTPNINYNKKVTPIGTFRYDNFPTSLKETLPTSNRISSKIEDPEGDVFLTLEQQGNKITNANPSIWSVFYVSGLIYWHVIPYWLGFNVVFYIIFTKLIEWIAPFNIQIFNTLVYGYQGVIVLIFLGFLFMIFMNNMAIWLAWKKYYRLKAQGNNEALFFSIFKQRAILQSINQYIKDDQGKFFTNNYKKGYYPAFNIEIMNQILNDLSPKLYSLYDKKFPINWG